MTNRHIYTRLLLLVSLQIQIKFLCRQSVLYVDKYTVYFVIVVAIETLSLSQINAICPTVPFVCMQSSDCDFSLTLAFTTLHAMKSTQSVRTRRLSVFFH